MVPIIDPEFRKKLDSLSPDTPVSVMVHPKPAPYLEGELNKHGNPIKIEGESQEDYNQRLEKFLQDSINPLCQYLDESGIKYVKGESFVFGDFRVRDINELEKQVLANLILDGAKRPFRAA
jgi:hypothetical protein